MICLLKCGSERVHARPMGNKPERFAAVEPELAHGRSPEKGLPALMPAQEVADRLNGRCLTLERQRPGLGFVVDPIPGHLLIAVSELSASDPVAGFPLSAYLSAPCKGFHSLSPVHGAPDLAAWPQILTHQLSVPLLYKSTDISAELLITAIRSRDIDTTTATDIDLNMHTAAAGEPI